MPWCRLAQLGGSFQPVVCRAGTAPAELKLKSRSSLPARPRWSISTHLESGGEIAIAHQVSFWFVCEEMKVVFVLCSIAPWLFVARSCLMR